MKNTLSGATLVLFAANLCLTFTEKVYHLALWTHPEKTRFLLVLCIVGAIFSMVVPFKLILILFGCCVLFPVAFFPLSNAVEEGESATLHLCRHQLYQQLP